MKGLSGARWEYKRYSGEETVLDQILTARGFRGEDKESFLSPKIRDALPDPFFLNGMREASRMLSESIRTSEKVGIYSDYDADGATSAGVLGRWLRTMGNPVHDLVIPHRIEHGYGPNGGLISGMFEGGSERIFILDSGTVAAPVLDALPEDQRKRIVVIDHHMPSGPVPDIAAVVNPNLVDQAPGMGHLAAVGVTFLLCVAAQRELVKSGALPQSSMQSLMDLLDYVAIGTVCDVVPLVGINRAFVFQGLQRVKTDETNPIGALLKVAGHDLRKKVTAKDCGFVIGPRLNAEGRIGDPRAAARFLLETDPQKIKAAAERIQTTNTERKTSQKMTTETALEDAERSKRGYSVVAIADGHVGIVGISASNLKDKYNKPAVVLTEVREGVLQGSARSMDGFNIGEAIHDAVHAGILLKGGGHAMAGGLTLEAEKLDAFRQHLDQAAENSDFGKNGFSNSYDLALNPEDMSVSLLESLDRLQPCGRDNPEPKFVLENARVTEVRTLSEKHVKVLIASGLDGKDSLDAIIWNGIGTDIGEKLLASKGGTLTLAGRFEINNYRGDNKVQMIVEDVLDSPHPNLLPSP